MNAERQTRPDPRMEQALTELQGLIRRHYPTASFAVTTGDDPVGTYLTAMVDVDDTDEVVDVVTDRLLTLQVEEALPLYLVPVRPLERIARTRHQVHHTRDGAALLPPL